MNDNDPESADAEGEEPYLPEDWLSASETIRIVRNATLSPQSSRAIALRANAGLLRTWAELLILNGQHYSEVQVPKTFWWAGGSEPSEQNWELGDFSTWLEQRREVQVFGVRFHRADLARMIPQAVIPKEPPPVSAKESGGRKMSQHWPEWVAELVTHIHNNGIPDGAGNRGADEMIEEIASRLADRGLDAPSRTTVQATMRAVLQRLRAGN